MSDFESKSYFVTQYELKFWRHVTFWEKLPGWRFRIKNLQGLGFWIKFLRVENGIKSFTKCHIPNLNFSNVTDFETKYYNESDFETKALQHLVNFLWCAKFWEKNFTTVWFFWTKVLQGVRIRFNIFTVCEFWNQYIHNVLDFWSIQLQDVRFWN